MPEQRPAHRPGDPTRGDAAPSLAPREHGAYAQLALPLLTAFGIAGVSLAGTLLAAAIVLVFMLHEPVLVMLGTRGLRARRDHGPAARRWALVLASLAGLLGLIGLAIAPPGARLGALVPGALALPFTYFLLAGREKTTAGELLAGATLASALLPVALAGAATPLSAGVAAGAWAASSAVSTLSVRDVVWRTRTRTRGTEPRPPALPVALLFLVVSLAFAFGDVVPTLAALAPAPGFVLCIALVLGGVQARHLRNVGWALVAAHVTTLVLLVAGLR